MSKPQTIPRTRSQVVGLTSKIKDFTKSVEKTTLLTQAELKKQHRHLLSQQPELFSGLVKLYVDNVAKFERIVRLYGGQGSRHSISSVGFSHLIEYCNNYELPDDDSTLKSICFAIFQIHSNDLRNGGANALFTIAAEYFNKPEVKTIVGEHIKIKSCNKVPVAIVNLKALTQVIPYRGVKALRTKLLETQDDVALEHIGSFYNTCKINGEFDAVSFCGLKLRQSCVITVAGHAIDVGPDYYRQMLAEVTALLKLKRKVGSVVMHGNNQFGFVKPLDASQTQSVTQIRKILNDASRASFINIKNAANRDEMVYAYENCLLYYITIPNTGNKSHCIQALNLSGLLEHRLLHYGSLGTKCRDPSCGVIGIDRPELYSELNRIVENTTIKDRADAMLEINADEVSSVKSSNSNKSSNKSKYVRNSIDKGHNLTDLSDANGDRYSHYSQMGKPSGSEIGKFITAEAVKGISDSTLNTTELNLKLAMLQASPATSSRSKVETDNQPNPIQPKDIKPVQKSSDELEEI
ncbi:VP6 [Liao ning virus]|uniref:VP6 n=1 Tax=Liao ning virus TaxID=246280 RepID=Q2TPU5_9REOV|nr:VP6 [Liao ning virus]AAW29089.1 VP6 [Liao ning virus]